MTDHREPAVTPPGARLAEVIPLDTVRGRLAMVWLAGAGIVSVVVVLQSLLGRFGSKTSEAWGWLLPTTMPTLLLIVTVLGYTALDPVLATAVVRRLFYRLAMVLSVSYLGLVALTVLIGPFAATSGAGMIDLMHMSNLWLGPFQGLVASALGVLFVTKQGKPAAQQDPLPVPATAGAPLPDLAGLPPPAAVAATPARPADLGLASVAQQPARFPSATLEPLPRPDGTSQAVPAGVAPVGAGPIAEPGPAAAGAGRAADLDNPSGQVDDPAPRKPGSWNRTS